MSDNFRDFYNNIKKKIRDHFGNDEDEKRYSIPYIEYQMVE